MDIEEDFAAMDLVVMVHKKSHDLKKYYLAPSKTLLKKFSLLNNILTNSIAATIHITPTTQKYTFLKL